MKHVNVNVNVNVLRQSQPQPQHASVSMSPSNRAFTTILTYACPTKNRLKTIKMKNIFTNVDVGIDGDPSRYLTTLSRTLPAENSARGR